MKSGTVKDDGSGAVQVTWEHKTATREEDRIFYFQIHLPAFRNDDGRHKIFSHFMDFLVENGIDFGSIKSSVKSKIWTNAVAEIDKLGWALTEIREVPVLAEHLCPCVQLEWDHKTVQQESRLQFYYRIPLDEFYKDKNRNRIFSNFLNFLIEDGLDFSPVSPENIDTGLDAAPLEL